MGNRGKRLEPRSIAEGIPGVNERGPSENVSGQYFAAPYRVAADSKGTAILRDHGY